MSGITHSFVSTKDQGGDATFVSKNEWNATHTGSDEWDSITVKGSDQSVTNSVTLVDDTALQWSVSSGEVWRFELVIVYDATTACDYKFDLAMSTGNMTGWWRYAGADTTANAINVSTGLRLAAATDTTDIAAGGQGAGSYSSMLIEGIVVVSATGTMKYRFAQNTQTASVNATTKAGSILKAKKLA